MKNGILAQQLFQCCQVVIQITIEARSDFDSGCYQEPTNATNAAGQNVTRDKTDDISEFEIAHEKIGKACDNGAKCVSRNSSRDHCIRFVCTDLLCDREGHCMEERNNFNLDIVLVKKQVCQRSVLPFRSQWRL